MIRAGIIGSTGYAGQELVRILLGHKDVEIKWYGSRSYIDQAYASVFQNMFQLVEDVCRDDNLEALADQVAEEGLPLYRDLDALTERTRGEYAVRVAAVKARATDVSLEVTNRIFEATGARSTATSFGFDLFWRNVRTHTLHDPRRWKVQHLGDYELNDIFPPANGIV